MLKTLNLTEIAQKGKCLEVMNFLESNFEPEEIEMLTNVQDIVNHAEEDFKKGLRLECPKLLKEGIINIDFDSHLIKYLGLTFTFLDAYETEDMLNSVYHGDIILIENDDFQAGHVNNLKALEPLMIRKMGERLTKKTQNITEVNDLRTDLNTVYKEYATVIRKYKYLKQEYKNLKQENDTLKEKLNTLS